ncbi:lipopolysaccharide biosynthesis protein [Rhodovulum sp. YNF3179]|uniref:lipopolysaccharide biosynthesis protein n=1 Tax=Rhodovulum sp. YNF3179 TaxID=3425127 RepID=UPI003D325252
MLLFTTDLERLLNIALRLVTLGVRFAFIIVLAKLLDPEMVGYYGLFSATVGYVIYLVGLDFYTYATREIIPTSAVKRGQFVKSQVALSLCLYVVVLPIALVSLSLTDWPVSLLWWFAPIVILEHFNQEVARLLIALSRPVGASLVLFLRKASWAILTVALLATTAESRHLDMVFALWAAGGFMAAAVGWVSISRLGIEGWQLPIDWLWLRRGIIVSFGFFMSTLALRGVQILDRYWLEALGGVEIVAVYVLFIGIAGSLLAFLDAGIFAFTYPELIRLNHEKDFKRLRTETCRALRQTVLSVVFFGGVSLILLPYLLAWVGTQVYQNESGIFPWVLSAMALQGISMVPHFALYAQGFDRPIIVSHVAALCVFVAATAVFSLNWPVLAVPIALNLSFLFVLLLKSAAYLYLTPRGSVVIAARPSS